MCQRLRTKTKEGGGKLQRTFRSSTVYYEKVEKRKRKKKRKKNIVVSRASHLLIRETNITNIITITNRF